MAERSNASDCKSDGLVPTGVRIPLPAQAAEVAQGLEQLFCKQ